jgi:DNA-binding transcriptional ArsR family regulator
MVDDVETLKALSDPTRIAILRALMDGVPDRPKVMSVKELAEELGEPQTKLYRHIKQLDARGLIQIAETRVVSGILENRYRTGQFSLDFDREFLGGQVGADDTARAFTVILDDFRTEFSGDLRAGRINFRTEPPSEESYRKLLVSRSIGTMSAAKATEFRDRLGQLIDELSDGPAEEDGVPFRFLGVFYSPEEP